MSKSQERLLRAALRSVRWSRVDAIIGFVGGAVVGALGYSAYQKQFPLPSSHKAGHIGSPTDAASIAPITLGAPPSSPFRRVSDHFVSDFDPTTRNPHWVAEHLTRSNAKGAADRTNVPFKEEPALPPHVRARLDDYAGSGYDRGHLAPAANHRNSDTAMSDTFYLSNIAPQVGSGFNRDYWARLEKFTRDLTKICDDVYVVTGPLYVPEWLKGRDKLAQPVVNGNGHGGDSDGPAAATAAAVAKQTSPEGHWAYKHSAIGSPFHWIQVPTHFYKAVYATGFSSSEGGSGNSNASLVAAFVLPNAPIPSDTALTDFLVPMTSLEAAAGVSLFRDALDAPSRAAVDAEGLKAAGCSSTGDAVKRLKKVYFGSTSGKNGYNGPFPPEIVPALEMGFKKNCSNDSIATMDAVNPLSGTTAINAAASLLASAGRRPVHHLCSVIRCNLPAEDWFAHKADGNGEGKKSNGSAKPGSPSPSSPSAAPAPAVVAKPASAAAVAQVTRPENSLDAAISSLGAALAADAAASGKRRG